MGKKFQAEQITSPTPISRRNRSDRTSVHWRTQAKEKITKNDEEDLDISDRWQRRMVKEDLQLKV